MPNKKGGTMKNMYFPSNSELESAVLQALVDLGGVADVPAIKTKLIENLNLSEEVVTLEDESGLGTKLDYRLRWARTTLKSKGKIKNIKRGTWEIIPE